MMQIRQAQVADAPEILRLIKDLALYEKEPHAVKTTIEDLIRDGFGSQAYFHTLIGELEGRAEALALYFFNWSTWEGRPSLYLEDLFVSEQHRGQSYGLQLLRELAKIAVQKKCGRFEWEVLDWNQPARDFYHKMGAHHKESWLPYRLSGENLIKFAQSDL